MESEESLFEFPAFPSGEPWDREMNEAEWRRLSWQSKRRRAIVSRARKIALLQHWSNKPDELGTPPFKVPIRRPGLRTWEDSKMGLWKWSDVEIDRPIGNNIAVMEAFQKAADAIERIVNGKMLSKGKKPDDQTEIIHRLELQVFSLMQEVRQLRIELYKSK